MSRTQSQLPSDCSAFDEQQGNPQAMSPCPKTAMVWMKSHRGSTVPVLGYCRRHAVREIERRAEA